MTLAGHKVPTKDALSLLSTAGQMGKKHKKGFVGQDKDMEPSLTDYHHRQKLDLNNLF